MITPPAALTLRCTDRSRHEAGLDRCPRYRYLHYHAGPHGYGYMRPSASMPAVTGSLVHQPLAAVLTYVKDHGTIPPPEVTYAAIQAAQAAYARIVETRGLDVILDPAELTLRLHEQQTLLEGLVWCWTRQVLPGWLETWRPILIEEEAPVVVGCTCGLGDLVGEPETHDSRVCQGYVYQTRGDVIAERRDPPHTLSYHEIKTTSLLSMNWEAQWPYRVQLVSGVLGAERRLERLIDEVYVHGLAKGRFESAWDSEQKKAVGPKYQNSPLVYGWRRPANPGLYDEQWAAEYNYTDEFGKRRKLTKDYQRTGLWELPAALWAGGDVQSAVDYWTRWIAPTGTLDGVVKVLGPYVREQWKLDQFVRQVIGEEGRWAALTWALYALEAEGVTWADGQFQAALDQGAPQNRAACATFFGAVCPMLALCERRPGWEVPDLLGYLPRRPHHAQELQQMEARGLAPEEWGEDEDAG